jgi:hypothetical protein
MQSPKDQQSLNKDAAINLQKQLKSSNFGE